MFEQASSRGHVQETENGLLTFPFTIRNQFTAALSTLDAAKNMRVEILDYQQNFYQNARNEGSKEKDKAIVFGDEKDAAKTYHLAEILKRNHINFNDIKQDFTVNGKQFDSHPNHTPLRIIDAFSFMCKHIEKHIRNYKFMENDDNNWFMLIRFV